MRCYKTPAAVSLLMNSLRTAQLKMFTFTLRTDFKLKTKNATLSVKHTKYTEGLRFQNLNIHQWSNQSRPLYDSAFFFSFPIICCKRCSNRLVVFDSFDCACFFNRDEEAHKTTVKLTY